MELAERIRIRTEVAKTCCSRIEARHGVPGTTRNGRDRTTRARDEDAVNYMAGAWAAAQAEHGEQGELTKTISMMAYMVGIHGYTYVRQMADWKQPADEAPADTDPATSRDAAGRIIPEGYEDKVR